MTMPIPRRTGQTNEPSVGLNATWQQVRNFHQLCGFAFGGTPAALSANRTATWSSWLREELKEFSASSSIEDQADAVIDLVYLALGALVEMGIPPQAIFDLVHKSNLAKVSPDGTVKCDVNGKLIKPQDWQSPKASIKSYIEELLSAQSTNSNSAQPSHAKLVVLLSGAIASGKSEVSTELTAHHAFRSVGTGKFLSERCATKGLTPSRTTLQNLGDDLDIQSDYQWPLDVAFRSIVKNPGVHRWLLDSVRKRQQVENFRACREIFVIHVHLTAPEQMLKSRYDNRAASLPADEEAVSYETAINHSNETASRKLSDIADLVLDTEALSPSEIATKILNLATEKGTSCGKLF